MEHKTDFDNVVYGRIHASFAQPKPKYPLFLFIIIAIALAVAGVVML